jgi:uncharacterized repeat protein (TIGR03803 family)
VTNKFLRSNACAFAISLATSFIAVCTCSAATEQVIYNYPRPNWGVGVELVYFSGRLYGSTPLGGDQACTFGCGSVFELAPKPGGGWNYHVLYAFRNASNGNNPNGKIMFDAFGNLYGGASGGGIEGCGGVFKLTPTATGPWRESMIYSFNGPDGCTPDGGVIADAVGNLYGTTFYGGLYDSGSAYKLTRNSDGSWSEATLYSFADQQNPYSELTMDAAGNLYGNIQNGGTSSHGSVYKLSPISGGGWTETVLFNFDGTNGWTPTGSLSMDSAGNLYGATNAGGANARGTVFELTPNADGTWNEVLLHSFGGEGDGSLPYGGLTPGGTGTFYGTTFMGGANNGGAVYQLKLGSDGQWSESLIYSFSLVDDGYSPQESVTFGPGNAMFGATSYGGTSDRGVIYEITP